MNVLVGFFSASVNAEANQSLVVMAIERNVVEDRFSSDVALAESNEKRERQRSRSACQNKMGRITSVTNQLQTNL